MKASKILHIISAVLIIVTLLAACSKGGESESTNADSAIDSEKTTSASETTGDNDSEPTKENVPDTPTLTPEPTIPDTLVVHPDATDIEITEASNTYVYIMPGMVAEAVEYFQEELAARGWDLLGKPTVMGHIATINMQQEGYRLTVSLQDNELSMTTRVQMLLMEQ